VAASEIVVKLANTGISTVCCAGTRSTTTAGVPIAGLVSMRRDQMSTVLNPWSLAWFVDATCSAG
jgi:hypothetical protein